MFSAILALLIMPFTDISRSRGIQFSPFSKIAFFIFIGNFLILMRLGAEHVESPFIEFGQISTALYFAHFLIIIPYISLFENSLTELGDNKEKENEYNPWLGTIVHSGWGSGPYGSPLEARMAQEMEAARLASAQARAQAIEA